MGKLGCTYLLFFTLLFSFDVLGNETKSSPGDFSIPEWIQGFEENDAGSVYATIIYKKKDLGETPILIENNKVIFNSTQDIVDMLGKLKNKDEVESFIKNHHFAMNSNLLCKKNKAQVCYLPEFHNKPIALVYDPETFRTYIFVANQLDNTTHELIKPLQIPEKTLLASNVIQWNTSKTSSSKFFHSLFLNGNISKNSYLFNYSTVSNINEESNFSTEIKTMFIAKYFDRSYIKLGFDNRNGSFFIKPINFIGLTFDNRVNLIEDQDKQSYNENWIIFLNQESSVQIFYQGSLIESFVSPPGSHLVNTQRFPTNVHGVLTVKVYDLDGNLIRTFNRYFVNNSRLPSLLFNEYQLQIGRSYDNINDINNKKLKDSAFINFYLNRRIFNHFGINTNITWITGNSNIELGSVIPLSYPFKLIYEPFLVASSNRETGVGMIVTALQSQNSSLSFTGRLISHKNETVNEYSNSDLNLTSGLIMSYQRNMYNNINLTINGSYLDNTISKSYTHDFLIKISKPFSILGAIVNSSISYSHNQLGNTIMCSLNFYQIYNTLLPQKISIAVSHNSLSNNNTSGSLLYQIEKIIPYSGNYSEFSTKFQKQNSSSIFSGNYMSKQKYLISTGTVARRNNLWSISNSLKTRLVLTPSMFGLTSFMGNSAVAIKSNSHRSLFLSSPLVAQEILPKSFNIFPLIKGDMNHISFDSEDPDYLAVIKPYYHQIPGIPNIVYPIIVDTTRLIMGSVKIVNDKGKSIKNAKLNLQQPCEECSFYSDYNGEIWLEYTKYNRNAYVLDGRNKCWITLPPQLNSETKNKSPSVICKK